MSRAFVILAAGKGTRLGGEPKQFRLLGGRSVWHWSLETARRLRREKLVDRIVLVLPPQMTPALPNGAIVVVGGASRALSVLSALRACDEDEVLLHDAARPFASVPLCRRLIAASTGKNAVAPLLPEANALKKIEDGRIEPLDRDGVYITQTPQLFPRAALRELLENAAPRAEFKDEAELWLQRGGTLDWVAGESVNFKVTEGGDWEMAQKIAGEGEIRTGLGYDVHPLVPGRKLILGGVSIDSALGLDGHSDADALAHAAADAVLSAAGLPDIGTLYPAGDEKFKDADSMALLRDALAKVNAEGWRLEWLSAVLTLQTPRLASWKEAIVRSLETVLGGGRLSVTFKSGERVGPAGDAQAVFVWASATLRR
ncbi:2-C-methyl-D-erythritol 2,4-cyclodiphosphate synthase [Pyramidobacter sp. SM-530-WT-4B]|uniref:2-C-methyl-D-erythritol 2,4-cyclodiphosphate synthase n=1 Tax=Pyramidobacter porci TaxID=2605789 RepID=A0A6L5YA37_9BACT|nr:2-C-methyl-D-erythritol 2,4-cyclodiphosphate synthase [Pyramidobacter porci]MCI6261487.1 2-C-methyl-D-erythritol 2,4-cyclodiphosphate synthase [Pyramidobacter sp.]MST55150.1 2-C-methyl-D-erythritol 2,4-cyclodiphosphate synthase [Pyramidobacter porci]